MLQGARENTLTKTSLSYIPIVYTVFMSTYSLTG